jgi:Ser/Thr protein kinase RdoA (MazF antagonist)
MECRGFKRPTLSLSEAEVVLQTYYNLSGMLRELPSERDQNFHLVTGANEQYVLKIAAENEKEETLLLQNAVLHHLATENCNTPMLRKSVNGKDIEKIESGYGIPYQIRLLTYLPGKVLGMSIHTH